MNCPWLVARDFNSVLVDHEISSNVHRSYSQFKECVDFFNLIDIGFQGPFFTGRHSNLKERLDRGLVN